MVPQPPRMTHNFISLEIMVLTVGQAEANHVTGLNRFMGSQPSSYNI